jgi:hypothetical protein
MRSFAELRTLELWYVHLDRDLEEIVREWASRVSRKQLRYFERNIAKARAKDSLRAFAKLTRMVDGHPRIVHDPPLVVPIEALARADDPETLAAAVDAALHYYRRTLPRDRRRLLERYRYIHAARKVVGVGSVGTRAWIMLMLDPDALGRYGELCGWALARAHARSGDAVAIGTYLGTGNTFDRAMCAFADGYADQNERDYEALSHAADAGRITVRRGL